MSRGMESAAPQVDKHEETKRSEHSSSLNECLQRDYGLLRPHGFDPIPRPHPKPPKPFSDLDNSIDFPSIKDLLNPQSNEKSVKDSKTVPPKLTGKDTNPSGSMDKGQDSKDAKASDVEESK